MAAAAEIPPSLIDLPISKGLQKVNTYFFWLTFILFAGFVECIRVCVFWACNFLIYCFYFQLCRFNMHNPEQKIFLLLKYKVFSSSLVAIFFHFFFLTDSLTRCWVWYWHKITGFTGSARETSWKSLLILDLIITLIVKKFLNHLFVSTSVLLYLGCKKGA